MAANQKSSIVKKLNKTSSDNIKTINKKSSFAVPFLLMLPAIIFFVLFTVLPLIKVVMDSTEPMKNYPNAYAAVWTDSQWYLSVFNSFVYAIISVPTTLAIALVISFSISNVIRTKFRSFWQTIFFLPYITSAVAISIVFSQIFASQQYGIVNWLFGSNLAWLDTSYDTSPVAFVPLLVYGIWHSLAFKVLILTSSMLAIDKRLYDSAAIDGASKREMFFNITLPSLNGTIWYLITIGLIGSMKVFPLALFGNSVDAAMDRMPTMLMYVYQYVGESPNYAKAGAASISLLGVVIVFNYIIKKGMFGIQNYFSNKKINQIKKEVDFYQERNIVSKNNTKQRFEETKKSVEEHISKKGGDN